MPNLIKMTEQFFGFDKFLEKIREKKEIRKKILFRPIPVPSVIIGSNELYYLMRGWLDF